ncbi:MAG TPA: carboxypeptidase-like regulatory domain-containing protein [Candidatus Solibacter sp.]|nr:carboxypeptidase-like regulatory domain-containing protein [Candidatus Solibacter sp.]
MKTRSNPILSVILLLVSCLGTLRAQELGSVSGTVMDPVGAAVTQERVKLQRASSGAVLQATTDAQGHFDFRNVEAGAYHLSAEADSFASAGRDVAVFSGRSVTENLQFQTVSSNQSVTVIAASPDSTSPDPAQRTFIHDELLEANPGRPGAPISIPGLPIETASGGIKAPQYFAPGVAGDHGEPIAQFFQIGDFLFPNNLPANAHGNGYADPNVLISNGIASVEADGGAFNVREGNHAVNLAVGYGLRDRLLPFTQFTADQHDADFVTGWSPLDPSKHEWLSLETSFGNGFLDRPEHRQQYKLNAFRGIKSGNHDITLFGIGYYGHSYIPGLIPTDEAVPGDTIDSRQHDSTHNTLMVATDTWRMTTSQSFDFSGFFRTYSLDLRSDFGDGLIRQSEFRTVSGGNASYLFKPTQNFSLLAGLDLRRDAPRNLDLDHADANGVLQPVTANDVTLGFVAPFVSVDGSATKLLHYDLGIRREEVTLDNVDKLVPANSFNKTAGITLPKGTLTLLPPKQKYLPKVAFSVGEAFHTNDPRIGNGTRTGVSGTPTVIVPSHAMQLVISKDIARTDFGVTLARVSNAQELAKIDPDTGLQEDVGPSLTRSITLTARRYFSFGSLQASWARATAVDRTTGEDIPEAPRLIWDVAGTIDRLPFGLRARSEFETVGAKPLGDGFTAVPVREFRVSLLRSFREGQMDLGLNSLIAHGYTGQTLETLQAPGQLSPAEQIVGVPLKSYVSLSWVYNFGRHR